MGDEKDDKLKPQVDAERRTLKIVQRSGAYEKASATADLAKSLDATGIGATLKAIDASGIGALQRAVDASSTGALMASMEASRIVPSMQIGSGIGVAMKAMAERHAAFGQRIQATLKVQDRPYAEMIEGYRESMAGIKLTLEASESMRSSVFANMPQIGSALADLNFERYGRVFEQLSITRNFGIDRTIAADFLSVSTRLSVQIKAMQAIATPKFDLGLSSNIEELLAHSLKVQEKMLEEQRQAGEGAATEARFQRRMAYFSAFIVLLTLFWTIAVDLEGRVQAENEVKANSSELTHMREAFEEMTDRLEALKEVEEKEADREAASDAEMAEIMRDIADMLREQSDDNDEVIEAP